MPAPTTTAELLELVFQSGLTDESRLRAFVANLTKTGSSPPDPPRLAAVLVRDGFLSYFQAEQLLQGKWKRFTVGEYTVLESLGAGTTSAFFLCEHRSVHRAVVIKVLPVPMAEDQRSLDRFYREARVLAACDHPNIVRAYDINADDGLHFLVMEYIDGTNLQKLVKRNGPLDPIRAVQFIAQAASALEHVHEQGFVHRNMKPGKLMLDRSGVIKLCGMGLAMHRRDGAPERGGAVAPVICGTPAYISPEQAIGSSSVDHRADIYSLGCTLYHLLAGHTPFPEGSSEQKLIWHQTRAPRPISSLRSDVPEELVRVLDRMMAKSADARYDSAGDVIAALAPWCGAKLPPPAAEELPQHCPRVWEALGRGNTNARN